MKQQLKTSNMERRLAASRLDRVLKTSTDQPAQAETPPIKKMAKRIDLKSVRRLVTVNA